MVPYNWISLLGASHQLNPPLRILKDLSVTDNRAMLIPEMSQNHFDEVCSIRRCLEDDILSALCFNCHVVSSTGIISAV